MARARSNHSDPLDEALAVLATYATSGDPAGESLADEVMAGLRERVILVRRDYRSHIEMSRGASRPGDVLREIKAIETASRDLANRLAGASSTTLEVLSGGFRGSSRSVSSSVRLLINRYSMPLAPFDVVADAREILSDLERGLAVSVEDADAPISWPVAAFAMAELMKFEARHFERTWEAHRRRRRNVLDHGRGIDGWDGPPDGRNRPADLGGTLHLLEDDRGSPRWVLVRECWNLLADVEDPVGRPISGHLSSPLAALSRAVFKFAAGVEPDDKGVGLAGYVQRAAKILGARHAIVMAQAMAAQGRAQFSEDQRQHLVSLDEALITGRVPNWLHDRRPRRVKGHSTKSDPVDD